jgi:hypothetical protein
MVWVSVQTSPQLQDLLRKPLFLAVFGFVAPQFDFAEWQQRTNDAERIEYLFDRYRDVAMSRVLMNAKNQDQGILSKTYGKRELPNQKGVRRALVFAARAMEEESQTELLIEKMQPSWLIDRQKHLYRLFFGLLLGLVSGLFVGVLIAMTFGVSSKLIIGPIAVLFCCLIFGGFSSFFGEKDDIKTVESLQFPDSFSEANKNFQAQINKNLIPIASGLAYFVVFGYQRVLIIWLSFVLISPLISIFKKDIDSGNQGKFNQGIKNTIKNMNSLIIISIICVIALKFPLEYFLPKLLPISSVPGISMIFCFALIGIPSYIGGGKTVLQHIALRIVLACNGYAPYRYDKLLDYCNERLLLQRIGGRYRFMHKLLQEHFAKMPLD